MIIVNLNKAKDIGHTIRRARREEEFAPYDNAIMKQIPGQIEGAEAQRQLIRDKYATMQNEIDAAQTPEDLKTILGL